MYTINTPGKRSARENEFFFVHHLLFFKKFGIMCEVSIAIEKYKVFFFRRSRFAQDITKRNWKMWGITQKN